MADYTHEICYVAGCLKINKEWAELEFISVLRTLEKTNPATVIKEYDAIRAWWPFAESLYVFGSRGVLKSDWHVIAAKQITIERFRKWNMF